MNTDRVKINVIDVLWYLLRSHLTHIMKKKNILNLKLLVFLKVASAILKLFDFYHHYFIV